jgi:hypothetical protein
MQKERRQILSTLYSEIPNERDYLGELVTGKKKLLKRFLEKQRVKGVNWVLLDRQSFH